MEEVFSCTVPPGCRRWKSSRPPRTVYAARPLQVSARPARAVYSSAADAQLPPLPCTARQAEARPRSSRHSGSADAAGMPSRTARHSVGARSRSYTLDGSEMPSVFGEFGPGGSHGGLWRSRLPGEGAGVGEGAVLPGPRGLSVTSGVCACPSGDGRAGVRDGSGAARRPEGVGLDGPAVTIPPPPYPLSGVSLPPPLKAAAATATAPARSSPETRIPRETAMTPPTTTVGPWGQKPRGLPSSVHRRPVGSR